MKSVIVLIHHMFSHEVEINFQSHEMNDSIDSDEIFSVYKLCNCMLLLKCSLVVYCPVMIKTYLNQLSKLQT